MNFVIVIFALFATTTAKAINDILFPVTASAPVSTYAVPVVFCPTTPTNYDGGNRVVTGYVVAASASVVSHSGVTSITCSVPVTTPVISYSVPAVTYSAPVVKYDVVATVPVVAVSSQAASSSVPAVYYSSNVSGVVSTNGVAAPVPLVVATADNSTSSSTAPDRAITYSDNVVIDLPVPTASPETTTKPAITNSVAEGKP